jgi:hypothetical protein
LWIPPKPPLQDIDAIRSEGNRAGAAPKDEHRFKIFEPTALQLDVHDCAPQYFNLMLRERCRVVF